MIRKYDHDTAWLARWGQEAVEKVHWENGEVLRALHQCRSHWLSESLLVNDGYSTGSSTLQRSSREEVLLLLLCRRNADINITLLKQCHCNVMIIEGSFTLSFVTSTFIQTLFSHISMLLITSDLQHNEEGMPKGRGQSINCLRCKSVKE